MSAKPVAWVLTDEKINDLQVTTVETIVRRAKAAHYCNVYLRINGKNELYEADWLKHMQVANDASSPAQARALAIQECARVVAAYKVSVGNSAAGEIAADMTMDALRELHGEILALAGQPEYPSSAEDEATRWRHGEKI